MDEPALGHFGPQLRYLHGMNPVRLLIAMLQDRSLRALLLLYLITGIADAAASTSFLYLTEDALGLERWGASLLMIQPIVALVALPFWSRLSARIGRRRVLMISYSWQAICAALMLFLPSEMPLVLAGFLAVKGLAWGVDYMLLRAMVADLTDKGEKGPADAGSYYGVSSIAVKIAMGLGSGGALWGLSIVSNGTADIQAVAIRLLHCMPIMIGALLALLILRGKGHVEGRPGMMAAIA